MSLLRGQMLHLPAFRFIGSGGTGIGTRSCSAIDVLMPILIDLFSRSSIIHILMRSSASIKGKLFLDIGVCFEILLGMYIVSVDDV